MRMKKLCICRSLVAGLVITAGSLDAQTHVAITNLLFSETFSGHELATIPTTVAAGGLWGTAVWTGPEGTCGVAADGENAFGQGTTNRFLRSTSTRNLSLITPAFFAQDVLSFGFDYIGRYPAGDGTRWLNAAVRIGTAYAHYTSVRNNNALIRTAATDIPANPSIGGNDVPVRILTIMNNRAESISYDRPDGLGTTNLDSVKASVWVYRYTGDQAGIWVHLIPQYVYLPSITNAGAFMDTIQIIIDSNAALRSFDLDNVEVYGSRGLLPTVHASITNLLFSEDFNRCEPGTPPATTAAGGLWGTATWTGTNGSWGVLEDALNAFGQGSGNRYLQLSNTHNLSPGLITPVFEPQEVLAYAFDFIGRFYPDDTSRWLNVDARNASGAAHVTSLTMSTSTIRTTTGSYSYGPNDVPVRVLTVLNNRAGNIIYDRPDGFGTASLAMGSASVWLCHSGVWEHAIPEYIYARTTNFPYGATMDRVRFFMDSNPFWRSFDLDNVAVRGSIEPAALPILLTTAIAGGNIEMRWVGKAGKSYQVQHRASLDSGDWSSLGSPIVPGVDGGQLFTDSLSSVVPRFYRVQVSAAP